MKKLSIVIPCYCSEKSIRSVVKSAITVLEAQHSYEYEFVLVNDGSQDRTWDELEKLSDEYSFIKAINFTKNYGQHNALIAAYRTITGDIIVGLDDDGEHDPQDMFKLIDKLEEGYDYVCASYPSGKKKSLFRNLGSWVNQQMAIKLINKPRDIEISSYYVERAFITKQIALNTNPHPYILGLLLQATNNIGTVELSKHDRIFGQSGYSIKRLLALWMDGFTAFSVKPLRVASVIGASVALAGFIYGIVIIIRKILNPYIMMGYSSLMAVILFVGGLIMLMLGLVGEYLGRTYISINGAPQYVIKEKKNIIE